MNDFYGKTIRNRGRQSAGERLISLTRSRMYDLAGFELVMTKRPLLVPAVLLMLCSTLSYLSESVVPAAVMCALTVFAGLCHMRIKKNADAVFPVIIISLILLNSGFYISSRLNAREDLDNTEFRCRVTSVSREMSGDTDVVVRLDGGAYSVLKYYGSDAGFAALKSGDILRLQGKIKEPRRAGNPGEFDYREYLKKQGILYVITCDSFEVCGSGFGAVITGQLQDFFFELRKDALNCVSSAFDGSSRALAAAVCTGDKSLIADPVRRDFKMSCCSHLLAVSGTHFSGFLVCLPMVLNAFRLKRKSAFAVHCLFCILIGSMTGWGDSVTRAAIMSICLFAGRDWLSSLCLASVVMTLADPFCPLSSGFQMSFCAVLGIKVISRKLTDLLMRLHLGGKISSVLAVAASAGLGMLPFWSEIAMRPDIEHILIQIAGSFIAGLACTCFIPCVFLCMMLPFWSSYLSTPLLLCIKALEKLVKAGCRLSEQGGAPVHLPKAVLIITAMTIFMFFMPPGILRRFALRLICPVLAVMLGINVFSFINRPSCRVVFADVGQGDCCLIMTPENTCLIDAGTYEEGATTVTDLLDHYGIGQVDICVMSHWDVDHSGGIAALCVQGRTKKIITSYVPSPDDRDKDVKDFFKATCLDAGEKTLYLKQLEPAQAGSRIYISGSVYLDVLYPNSRKGGGNEDSLVAMLHIECEDPVDILFTGDIGKDTEKLLMEDSIDLDCDILKVAHHGSKYSSTAEFIEACSPDIAVISVGENNFYGHPAPATLERLEAYGCDVFRTDKEGAVVLEY